MYLHNTRTYCIVVIAITSIFIATVIPSIFIVTVIPSIFIVTVIPSIFPIAVVVTDGVQGTGNSSYQGPDQ